MFMQVFIERAQTLLHTTLSCPLILLGGVYLKFEYLDELITRRNNDLFYQPGFFHFPSMFRFEHARPTASKTRCIQFSSSGRTTTTPKPCCSPSIGITRAGEGQ